MAFRNQRLDRKRSTIDASEEVRVQVEFLEVVDRLDAEGLLNLSNLLFCFLFFVLHIITSTVEIAASKYFRIDYNNK